METHDIEAEAAVLGSLIENNDFIYRVSDVLKDEYFYDSLHREIFSIMKRVHENFGYFDSILIGDEYKAKDPFSSEKYHFIDELKEHAPRIYKKAKLEKFVIETCKVIEEKYKIRSLVNILGDMAHKIQMADSNINYDDFKNDVIKNLILSGEDRSKEKSVKLTDIAKDLVKDLEKRSESDSSITGHPTGFKDLDNITRGFQDSDLIIIGARPSMGKSALALNLTMGIHNQWLNSGKKDNRAMFFSLEMDNKQVLKRMLAAKAKIPLDCFYTGKMDGEQWDKLGETMSLLDDSILVDDTPKISVSYIKQKIRQVEQEIGKINIIVVDYLQIMRGESKFSRENEISSISSGLKGLAKEFDIPVIALCQVSRELEKRPIYDDRAGRPGRIPVMSDLRESGAIEQDADIVAFLYRDEVYNVESQEPGIARLSVAKHRNGKLGEVMLRWSAPHQIFRNY